MNRKIPWILAGVLIVGLAGTAHAEVVDMGGFQIQVGQKQDVGIGPAGGDGIGQEPGQESLQKPQAVHGGEIPAKTPAASVMPVIPMESPKGAAQENLSAEPQERQGQQEEPVSDMFGWTGQYGQAVHGQEAQADTGLEEAIQDYGWAGNASGTEGSVYPDGIQQQGTEPQQDGGQETAETEIYPAGRDRQGKQGKQKKQESETEKEESKKEQPEDTKTAGNQPGIRFIHEDFVRLENGLVPSVRLEGGLEICVISYSVNHRECASRWEGDYLLPVDPPLRKGVNCLELAVLSRDGQVIVMEPWYFSCGVGAAVL